MNITKRTLAKMGLLIIFLFTLGAGSIMAQDECKKEMEKYPEPVGGLKAIMKNVDYPAEAKKEGIQGKVFVVAKISKEGKVVSVRIEKSENEMLNESALEAVKKTSFIPGEKDGKKVDAEVTIPIMYKLK